MTPKVRLCVPTVLFLFVALLWASLEQCMGWKRWPICEMGMSQHRVALLQLHWCLGGGRDFPTGDGGGTGSRGVPSTPCQSQTLWLHPKPAHVLTTQPQTLWLHPKPTHILTMHSQTLWPSCILSTHSQLNTLSTFSLLAPSGFLTSIPIPTQCSFDLLSFCIKSTPNVSLVSWLQSGKAQSCTFLARYILVCPFSLSIYLFFLLSTVHSLYLIVHYPLLALYVSSSIPHLHSLSFSSIFIPDFHQPYSVIPYLPYNLFLFIQINPILTTPCTCINTLVTSCCSSVW